jgi:anti-sigma regulatory factor (Ser/Thr protein kinase)
LLQAGVGTTPHRHEVFFYDVDRELVAAVARYVSEGLADGEPVVVVATSLHLAAIDDALSDQGTDVSSARATGSYLALDAADTLDTFMVDGLPDADRFMGVVGGLLDAPRDAGADLRAFGEMVALLWDQGNVPGAIALESLWNDLKDHYRFSLLCAYPTTGLAAAELGDLSTVCRLHTAVRPPSGYDSPSPSGSGTGASTRSGVFVPAPEAVGAARRFIREALTSWGAHDLVDDGELIVSELATNAVIHGDSPFRTSIERSADAVRIAVEDAGQGLPQSRTAPHDALDGRGVAIVEALARRWGCDRLDGGKVFWAELGIASAQPV